MWVGFLNRLMFFNFFKYFLKLKNDKYSLGDSFLDPVFMQQKLCE